MGSRAVIVLDTHTLVWWVSGNSLLSSNAQNAIEKELVDGALIISSISAWEIAILVAKGRLVLSMDVSSWLATVATIERVQFMPVDNEIAVKSTELPGEFHKDPADRLIVSTARKFAVSLVTADEKIRAYEHVKSIW
jgi:PIN domain nuclease of toxin-antitoxin system